VTVVLVSDDLMLRSQVAGHALRLGMAPPTQTTVGALASCLDDVQPRLLILDLAAGGMDVAETTDLARRTTGTKLRIVAFAPHVHQQRLQQASDAGCDVVLSRGQFVRQLDELLESVVDDGTSGTPEG